MPNLFTKEGLEEWILKEKNTRENEAAAQQEKDRLKQQQTDIQNKQADSAKAYRAKLPATQEQMFGQVANKTRRNLASQAVNTNSAYNSRGLLYSGLRQGALAEDRANAGADLAQARALINQQTNANADTVDQNVIRSGAGLQELDLVNEDLIYQKALAAAEQRMGLMRGVGSGVGSALGGGLAMLRGN